MDYVKLGKTGLSVSRICLGMMSYGDPSILKWCLDINASQPIVEKALDLGINFFDTANVYSRGRSEEITGELLKEYRDDVVIATKVFFPVEGFVTTPKPNKSGLSRYHITRAIKDSLNRLNMDYVDLYQIHRLDPHTPIEEILRSLNLLIDNGSVLHIGASSMFAWQFAKSLWLAEQYGLEPFRTMQNHYNLCYREEEREMLPLCKDQGLGVIPWSPLARGFLSGKYTRDGNADDHIRARTDRYMKPRFFKPEDFDVVERVVEIAQEKDVKPAQIALAWLFSKDYVTSPIIGATKIEHVEEAVEALDIKLTENEIKRLEEPYKPHFILGHS
ncbi:MAG: aldo/keto reductase [Candidatus Heimdallarchaeota archaeon]|nr:MAG: aldo/keto reductase [Candidatus Heimdallarchaeota archaeon]